MTGTNNGKGIGMKTQTLLIGILPFLSGLIFMIVWWNLK